MIQKPMPDKACSGDSLARPQGPTVAALAAALLLAMSGAAHGIAVPPADARLAERTPLAGPPVAGRAEASPLRVTANGGLYRRAGRNGERSLPP